MEVFFVMQIIYVSECNEARSEKQKFKFSKCLQMWSEIEEKIALLALN